MKITRILHIIYILEIILTNRFTSPNDKSFFIKILIFFLFLTFTIILHASEFQATRLKLQCIKLVEKYESLYDKYITYLNENYHLKKQVKNFDIPVHIKYQYIEYLISKNHKCSICLSKIEKNDNVFLTICGHLYHNECINHDFNNSNKCPNCRKFIPKKDLSEIIDFDDSDDEVDEDNEEQNLIVITN